MSDRFVKKSRVKVGAVVLLLALHATLTGARATTVTVQEVSVSPAKVVNIKVDGFYTGGAYAGVVNMLVDGVATQGFCIDPFHFSSTTPLPYNIVALEDAPKDLLNVYDGPMGAAKADQIEKLWGMAYLPNSAGWDATKAAALQIAIWEIVAGDKFTVTSSTDYGAGALLESLKTYTGPSADLVALTGSGQDYVVQRVPDAGATLGLLAIGLGVLGVCRRQRS